MVWLKESLAVGESWCNRHCHPGPINRGVEFSSEVADVKHSVIFWDQSKTNGESRCEWQGCLWRWVGQLQSGWNIVSNEGWKIAWKLRIQKWSYYRPEVKTLIGNGFVHRPIQKIGKRLADAPAGFERCWDCECDRSMVCRVSGSCGGYVETWLTQKGSVATERSCSGFRWWTTLVCPPDTPPYCGYACGCKAFNSRQSGPRRNGLMVFPIGALTPRVGRRKTLSKIWWHWRDAGCIAVSNQSPIPMGKY